MSLFMKKPRLYDPFSRMVFNCLKARMKMKLLVLIFYQLLKNKQQKYQNLIQRKESVVAKMLFPQVDEGFWL